MKILFVGVLDVYWSTNCEMRDALILLGHDVHDFNYRSIESNYSSLALCKFCERFLGYLRRFNNIPKILSKYYYSISGRGEMNEHLLRVAINGDYDLVLLLKTDTVNPETISMISTKVATWYYFMDPLDQSERINAKKYAKNSTFASATFSDVVSEFLHENPLSFWMTQGIDSNIFKPKTIHKDIDIFFAGTRDSHREKMVDTFRAKGLNIVCYGRGWENPPIFHNDLVQFYQKSKIVLNICRGGSGFSIRVFQVLGSGSFLLSDYCEDLEKVFTKGVHMEWSSDIGILADQAMYYLSNKSHREDIEKNGCKFTHKEKNWMVLMEQLIDKVKESKKDLTVEKLI
jgi:hypothetical protein